MCQGGMGLELASGIPLASGGTGVPLQHGSSGKGARGISVNHHALPVGKGFRELGCGGNVRRLRKAMACAPGLRGPPATNWLAPAGPQPQGLAQPHGKQC